MKIITLTMNPTIDTDFDVEQVMPERKLRCGSPRRQPGGGGVNVSRAIYQLGGESTAIFTAGGIFSRKILNEMAGWGINCKTIEIEKDIRESINVLEKNSLQQFRFVLPGPEISKQEWQEAIDMFDELDEKPEFVVLSGSLPPEVPHDFYARVAEKVKTSGARVIVDTSGENLKPALEEGVYLIKPNMNELRSLANGEMKNEAQQKEFISELVKSGKCQVAVLSLGTGGAMYALGNEVKHVRAPSVPIKSKVGAGDSMVAGIVLSLARGRSEEEAIKYGVAAGSAAVMTPGTELCRKEDTENIFKGMQ